MKNYDYLSYDHHNGMSQWSIFYSEFSDTKVQQKETSSLISSTMIDPSAELSIFAKGNLLYSLRLNEKGETT
jgi:hypothetical protein